MTRRKQLLAAVGIAACLAAMVGLRAQTPGPTYLVPGAFDILAVLPAAPHSGDARDQADREIFRSTRALAGTARWDLAINDVKLTPADMMRDFSCAAGVVLTPDTVPHVMSLIGKAAADTADASRIAKDHYQRKRPYQVDSGPVCQPPAELRGSPDYPSGHTTLGWTWAMILAELMPDRATAILARGRAYGESRIVCGVHNQSAVDAGRTTASATLAVIRANPAFQADLESARRELADLRDRPVGPPPATCAAEARLVAQPIP